MDKKVTNELNIEELQNDLNKYNTEKEMFNLLTETNYEEKNAYMKNAKKKKGTKEEIKGRNQFLEELDFLRNIYINQFIEESLKRNDMNAKNFIPTHTKNLKEKEMNKNKEKSEKILKKQNFIKSVYEKNMKPNQKPKSSYSFFCTFILDFSILSFSNNSFSFFKFNLFKLILIFYSL